MSAAADNEKSFPKPPGLTILRELVGTGAPGTGNAVSGGRGAAPRRETCVLKVVSLNAVDLV